MPHPSGCGLDPSTQRPSCYSPPVSSAASALRASATACRSSSGEAPRARAPSRGFLMTAAFFLASAILAARASTGFAGAPAGGGRGPRLCDAGHLLLERLDSGLDGGLLIVTGEPFRPRFIARLLDDHRLLLRHLDLAGALVHRHPGLGRRLDDGFLGRLQVVLLPLLDLGQRVHLAEDVVAEPLLRQQG